MLTRLGLLTFGKGAKIHSGQAGKCAANGQVKALASIVRALRGNGVVSFSGPDPGKPSVRFC